MAKKPEGKKKALLLVDCHAGKCAQVVELNASEIAALVAFLLSAPAAAITGQDIAICGGSSLAR